MQTIFIDGNKFSTFEQFLNYMSGMLLDSSYNHSLEGLDAFADVLEGGFGIYAESEEVKIKWKDAKKSKKDLGAEETVIYFNKILENCHPSNREEVKEQIIFTQTDDRYNLFYFILDILLDAKNVTSVELF